MPPLSDVFCVPLPGTSLAELLRAGSGMLLAHCIRGRRRYVCPALRGRSRACEKLESMLQKFPGMTSARVSPVTGSVTVCYTLREAEMDALFDALSPGSTPGRLREPRTAETGRRGRTAASSRAGSARTGQAGTSRFKFAAGLALLLAGAAKILLEQNHEDRSQLLLGLGKLLLGDEHSVDPRLLRDLEVLQEFIGESGHSGREQFF